MEPRKKRPKVHDQGECDAGQGDTTGKEEEEEIYGPKDTDDVHEDREMLWEQCLQVRKQEIQQHCSALKHILYGCLLCLFLVCVGGPPWLIPYASARRRS
jgi:hypothetical protein